ncbi:MAG TPA: AraC family transcriptional regulator [Atopostipes sp.]|nr:AraC family transcriptional regulator [Atopostipes sp.]
MLSKTTLLKEYVCYFEADSESTQLMKEIVRFNQNNLNNELTNLWNHSQLYAFLYQINLEFVNKVEIATFNLSQDQLADFIIDYIYENYDEKILVQDIADEFNVSRSYLYKICMKRFEKTPKEILLDLRLGSSKQLLLYTDLLIKEIADQVGFSNPLYFSKVFKAAYGYSPSEYRQLKEEQLYY